MLGHVSIFSGALTKILCPFVIGIFRPPPPQGYKNILLGLPLVLLYTLFPSLTHQNVFGVKIQLKIQRWPTCSTTSGFNTALSAVRQSSQQEAVSPDQRINTQTPASCSALQGRSSCQLPEEKKGPSRVQVLLAPASSP